MWRRADAELRDELLSHLERHIDILMAEGRTREDAEREARKEFGGVAQAEEACRDARRTRWIEDVGQDVVYASRLLRKSPVVTAVLVLTLAIAIAASTAVFGLFDAILLKALPLPSPQQIVVIAEQRPNVPRGPVSYPDFLDWRARQRSFSDLAAVIPTGGVITGDGDAERVFGRAVSREFFRTLGIALAAGRAFSAEEDRPDGDRAMILSDSLWRRRFGADPGAVGRPVRYNGEPYTIVGVLPPDFDFYGTGNVNNDVFVPIGLLSAAPYMQKRENHLVSVIGRVKPGVTVAEATNELTAIADALATEHASTNAGVGVVVRSLLDDYVGNVRLAMWVLLVAATFVLAIACANVANVLLGRGAARAREMATRVALGAGRGRLVRQLVTESLLLAGIGGVVGLGGGLWATTMLSTAAAQSLPRLSDAAFNWRIATFAVLVTAVAGLAFGAASAWHTIRANNRGPIVGGSRTVVSVGRIRDVLVVFEVALSLALVIAAGLLLRSFANLTQLDRGYDGRDVLTFRLRLPDADYPNVEKVSATLAAAIGRIKSVAGVEHACLTTGVPFGRAGTDAFEIAGRPCTLPLHLPIALTQWVSPEYFDTLRIRLIAGRTFGHQDDERGALVAVVDQDFVNAQFGGRSPASVLGEHVRFPTTDDRWRRIVGVVQHLRHGALDEDARAEVYAPFDQLPTLLKTEFGRAIDVAVRARVPPRTLVENIKAQIRAIDPDVPLSLVRTLDEATAASMAPRRLNILLVGVFAGAALVLCIVGIYGVVSYSVTERTRELAVRLAVGAAPNTVLRMVLRRGLGLAVIGAALGIALALAVGQLIDTLLVSVAPTDLVTLCGGTLLVLAVAACASFVPARRAMRLDPILALREQ